MSVELRSYGIRLYAGWGVPHDYLWFSSTESARLSTTLAVLHNYALTFSVSQRSWAAYAGTVPDYNRDLAACPYYALCAAWYGSTRVRLTQNGVDELTQRTDTGEGNTPSLSYRVCLTPATSLQPETGFRVFVFGFDGSEPPPGVTRLGKKGCAVRWHWVEVRETRAELTRIGSRPSHPVNPLDLASPPVSYEPVVIPPHLVYRVAELQNEIIVRYRSEVIHVPDRVLRRAGIDRSQWEPAA